MMPTWTLDMMLDPPPVGLTRWRFDAPFFDRELTNDVSGLPEVTLTAASLLGSSKSFGPGDVHQVIFSLPPAEAHEEPEEYMLFYSISSCTIWRVPNPVSITVSYGLGHPGLIRGPLLFVRIVKHNETRYKQEDVRWTEADGTASRLQTWVLERWGASADENVSVTHSPETCDGACRRR